MKTYLLFRLKDPKAKKKEFIVDSVYTTLDGAFRRQERIHNCKEHVLILYNLNSKRNKQGDNVIVSPNQQTFIINKTLKGYIKSKENN